MSNSVRFGCGLLLIWLLSVFGPLAAQQVAVQVSGRITGIDGEPLRVTIRSKRNGMAQGQENGNYGISLKVLPDTLAFSALGYVTLSRVVAQAGTLDLKLTPSVQQLDQVVVQTGYQTLKPNEINGTVSVISEQAINATTGTNILDRILKQSSGLLLNTGKVPGNPQNRTNISIRGLGTIEGPLDPLVVLDGFIYEGELANIHPNDVENVSILKDASAASIWGARAGNGVIVITSKKGRLNQALQLGFSANVIIEGMPKLSVISQMEAKDYIEVEKMLFERGYFNDQITRTPFRALTPAVEVLLQQRLGNLSAGQAQAQLDYLATQDSRQHYLREFYTHALTQQYGLSLRGGGIAHSYFISANHDRTLSENFAMGQKLNLKFSNDFKLGRDLTLTSLAAYTAFTGSSGRPAFGSIATGGRSPVYLGFRDAGGMAIPIDRNYRAAYTDTAARGKLLDWKYYPLEDYLHEYQEQKRE